MLIIHNHSYFSRFLNIFCLSPNKCSIYQLDYLLNDEETNKGEPSKFDQILAILKELREKTDSSGEDYKNYEIFVTGHSLGGALAQLFSAALARSSMVAEGDVPLPVTAVTYGSPMVGDKTWLKEYQSLEHKGSLRHLRVSNSGDYVCVWPRFPVTFPFMGYTQTGVNIHLFKDAKADVAYINQRSIFSAFEFSMPNVMHRLSTYRDRLFNDLNEDILDKSVEDFYKEHASNYTK